MLDKLIDKVQVWYRNRVLVSTYDGEYLWRVVHEGYVLDVRIVEIMFASKCTYVEP